MSLCIKNENQLSPELFIFRPIMETALNERGRVGVQDAILLEDYTSVDAFVNNLKKRFKENLIYVSQY